MHALFECGINDILCAYDVCLHALFRIVFSSLDGVDGCSMNNNVHTLTCTHQSVLVANIAYEETKLWILSLGVKHLNFLMLLNVT